ncbi:MAG: oligosaccharide flippase family protein [Alkalibacterium sp.]|nr:oligosaccharide flippase family protein [Alkalibacterium sp.]
MKSQKKSGIAISYLTLFINSFYGIFFTPFLISSLGAAEYGLYQLVHSFAGYLVILNFGTGAVVSRYVALYRTKKDYFGQENFLYHSFLITGVLSILTLIVSAALFFGIEGLFGNSLTSTELETAKQLFILMVFNISISFITNAFSGILMGYEQFAVTNTFKLARVILRLVTLVILLMMGFKSIAIVSTDLFLTVLLTISEAIYSFKVLKVKIKFHFYDKPLLWLIFSFSSAIFLQAIINQVNQNVDRVVLGAMTDTETVALYSIALVFFTMFSNITGVIGGVFLPQATSMIAKNATGEELTNLVIKPGRLQFMVAGAAVAGFILFGPNFIRIWVGSNFLGAYIPTILLLVPSTITLVQNVTIAILDAKLKRMTRSLILGIMAALNILLTILLVERIGYIGAAISTSISLVLGNIVMMNIYYHKVIGLNVIRMFKEIFRGTFPSIIIASILSIPLTFILEDTVVNFVIKASIFIVIYIISLYKISFNDYEKNLLLGIAKTVRIKK